MKHVDVRRRHELESGLTDFVVVPLQLRLDVECIRRASQDQHRQREKQYLSHELLPLE
jgi:hypothetical protein